MGEVEAAVKVGEVAATARVGATELGEEGDVRKGQRLPSEESVGVKP